MTSRVVTDLPDDLQKGFDQIIDRFDDAWQQGQRPDIAQFLPDDDRLRLAVLRELVHADLECRCKSGEKPSTNEYLARFPELNSITCFAQILDLAIRRLNPDSEPTESIDTVVSNQGSVHDPDNNLPERIGRYRVERVLGKGGFGLVFLAYDEKLERHVAVKVPHAKLVSRPEDAEAYLTEARTVASLKHPHIVAVHDVGSTDQFPCYVVSEFIDGTDLSSRLKQSRLNLNEAVELVATVAEALHYAHKRGLVHRDIKPGNILIDKNGTAFVVDFGLALREQDLGKGPRYAGTPAYMSPEQARGEGHRVDGRSDIFSLGVVFYELLVGRRPFRGDSQAELLDEIISHESRPLRQYDDSIPKELERICLKSLSKRASERYSTAKDMADDLRHFLSQYSGPTTSVVSASITPVVQPPSTLGESGGSTPTTPISDSKPIKIVPKGLRSFDAHDADFFLELLPGPRDRDGLPDSLRFWKTRIEETDADSTFSVGLIYGPSGCGKSSLVKAGLLPRLSENVIAVYVEATAEETETRLLNGLRKRCPTLPDHLSLKETLAVLRRGHGKKVVIVLDQFEQWLHAKKDEQNTELVQALRQCDGGRLQCIVMVRDDFWMATTRFLAELEIKLLQGHNLAAADLFPIRHAEKVLAAFGRAFGVLPDVSTDASIEQKRFLEQAVSGLAQEGKVICVRLALFAEMLKGKAWTPTTLKEVGGTEGVGITFLEEIFSSKTANPQHRLHQKAARAVLKSLLPESGTDIKGHMRSRADLLEASGYGSRPKEFDDLIRILDSEIRLITPTDPEGQEESSASSMETGERYYQLTHDYLVPSLRDWLTRKQKETRRGRAELLLTDRATLWHFHKENRQLPSLVQWLHIRLLTRGKNWTLQQRKMMRQAAKYHSVRSAAIAVLFLLVGWGGYETHGSKRAYQLREQLLDADPIEVPKLVGDMTSHARWLAPLLRDARIELGEVIDGYYADSDQAYDLAAKRAKKNAKLDLALLFLNQGEDFWPKLWSQLKHSRDPTLRSYLIEWLNQDNASLRKMMDQLELQNDVSVKRAILLSLGEDKRQILSQAEQRSKLDRTLELYEHDPDPGIHSAAEWQLRQWKMLDEIKTIDRGLITGNFEGKRKWYLTRDGHTMMMIPKSDDYLRYRDHPPSDRTIAIASKELTNRQFALFRSGHHHYPESLDDAPVTNVSWFDAAAYCNWLSEREGIKKDQWVYEKNLDGKYSVSSSNWMERMGYRLPTYSEWLYSAHAGATAEFSFGRTDDLLGKYAWSSANSNGHSRSGGALKPNDFGLFDMHGNVAEWYGRFRESEAWPVGEARKLYQRLESRDDLMNPRCTLAAGGSFLDRPSAASMSGVGRIYSQPEVHLIDVGFRLAKTIVWPPDDPLPTASE